MFINQARSNLPFLYDPLTNDYITNLGQQLLEHVGNRPFAFHFFIIKDNSINAFAGPGGYIGIHTGLILKSQTESQLAAVMAHEIAHVTQKHIARGLAKTKGLQMPTLISMLGALIFGTTTGQGHISSGILAATLAANAESSMQFTREEEQEADNTAIKTLQKSGLDPRGLHEFFNQMQRLHMHEHDELIPSTHPDTNQRLSESMQRTMRLPKKTILSSLNYHIIKQRLTILLTKNIKQLTAHLKEQPDNGNKNQTLAHQYGYAFALYKEKQYNRAYKKTRILQQLIPHNIPTQLLTAHILEKKHALKKAEKTIKTTLDLYPNSHATFQAYINILIQIKAYKKAKNIITKKIIATPNDPSLYLMLASIQNKQKHYAPAAESLAQAAILLKQPHRANTILKQLLHQKKLSKHDQARIKGLITQAKTLNQHIQATLTS